jgi:hypothetical protein
MRKAAIVLAAVLLAFVVLVLLIPRLVSVDFLKPRLVSALEGKPATDFQVKVALKDLAAEEILSRKTSLKDFISGPVSLSANLGGGMEDFADFTRTATGAGSIKVTGGKIKWLYLLSTAAGFSGLPSLVPGASETRGDAVRGETPFSDLSASFRVEGGRIR